MEDDLYTKEEYEKFERDFEEKRRRFFNDQHAQPGEVNVSCRNWSLLRKGSGCSGDGYLSPISPISVEIQF